MKLGISGATMGEAGSPQNLVDYATLAEDLGFSFISLGDSQALLRELYSCLGVMAQATSKIEIGPVVTNPVTRHPVVTASAMFTLNELSDGRVFLGIASGDSAVITIGKTPANLAKLEEVVRGIKALGRGELAVFDDTTVEMSWVTEANQPREVPIMIAAEGPKTQRLAGQIADRVLIGTGLLPEVLEEQISHVHEGARAVNRDPSGIEVWVMGRSNIADSKTDALEPIKSSLAGAANHALRFTMEGKRVPEEYTDAFNELLSRYDTSHHSEPGTSPNAALLDELGLTEYVADRWGVVGTPQEYIEKLETVDSIEGIDGVFLTTPTDQTRRVMRRIGDDVIPSLP